MLLLQVQTCDTIKVLSVNPPMTFGECLRDPSTIIAICAVVISVIGLGLALWTGYLTRKHNRLSVEPILDIYSILLDDKQCLSLDLENNGLGTAILNTVKFHYNNVEYNNMLDIIDTKKITYKYEISSFHSSDDGTTISSNSKIRLYSIYVDSFEESKPFLDLFFEISLSVDFKTMYGEKRHFISKLVPETMYKA